MTDVRTCDRCNIPINSRTEEYIEVVFYSPYEPRNGQIKHLCRECITLWDKFIKKKINK